MTDTFTYSIDGNNFTTALVVSPAGDTFLRVFPGHIDEGTIRDEMFNEDTNWWATPDNVEVHDMVYVTTTN